MKDNVPFFNRLTISVRLTLWYGLSLFIMLSIFAFFLYESFHEALHHDYDRHLQFETEQLLPHIKASQDALSIDLSNYGRNEALTSKGTYGTFVRLFQKNGTEIYHSPNINPDSMLAFQPPNQIHQTSLSRTWHKLPARTLYTPLKNNGELAGWLEVTGYEWTLHTELQRLRDYMIFIVIICILFSIGGGYWLANRALSPVTSFIYAARSVRFSELSRRLPVNHQVQDELTELADTFNEMLDRLERGFEHEKRFTSDAAHELLTPLASILNQTEILLRKQRSVEEYREGIEQLHEQTQKASTMVQLLLQLSRVEASRPVQMHNVEMSEVISSQIEKLIDRIKEKKLKVKLEEADPGYIKMNYSHAEQIVFNLLHNAVKYTPDGGSISISWLRIDHYGELVVEDTGIGFSKETQDRIYDRFYRSDDAPVQSETGSGLGLSLVKAIISHYGGIITAHSDGPGEGSRFIVKIPV
ncbi:MAG TPA: ATP-binding protein [Balneolales bacterium]|nr:ATP-binding protein [Balneolales bacterium]